MAIFFIIKIDEEIYNISEFKNNEFALIFCRWIVSSLYTDIDKSLEKFIRYECNAWQNNFKKTVNKYRKNKINNSI